MPLAHHPLPGLTSVRTFGAVRVPTRCSRRPNISEVTANKCGSGAAQYVTEGFWVVFLPPLVFTFWPTLKGRLVFRSRVVR